MTLRTIQKLVLITLCTLSLSVSADEKIDWTGFYGSAMVGRDWGHVSEGGGILHLQALTTLVIFMKPPYWLMMDQV
jgi:hypothetical protein